MAKNCGCAGGSCTCLVQGGEAVRVTGSGTAIDPYVTAFPVNGPRLPRFSTASRPTAASAGVGAVIYNTTTLLPNYSDGTAWRNAAGTIV